MNESPGNGSISNTSAKSPDHQKVASVLFKEQYATSPSDSEDSASEVLDAANDMFDIFGLDSNPYAGHDNGTNSMTDELIQKPSRPSPIKKVSSRVLNLLTTKPKTPKTPKTPKSKRSVLPSATRITKSRSNLSRMVITSEANVDITTTQFKDTPTIHEDSGYSPFDDIDPHDMDNGKANRSTKSVIPNDSTHDSTSTMVFNGVTIEDIVTDIATST